MHLLSGSLKSACRRNVLKASAMWDVICSHLRRGQFSNLARLDPRRIWCEHMCFLYSCGVGRSLRLITCIGGSTYLDVQEKEVTLSGLRTDSFSGFALLQYGRLSQRCVCLLQSFCKARSICPTIASGGYTLWLNNILRWVLPTEWLIRSRISISDARRPFAWYSICVLVSTLVPLSHVQG